jgi:hypothetical protein
MTMPTNFKLGQYSLKLLKIVNDENTLNKFKKIIKRKKENQKSMGFQI